MLSNAVGRKGPVKTTSENVHPKKMSDEDFISMSAQMKCSTGPDLLAESLQVFTLSA